jgi:catechol 2,3-dioxygenase-like lactoylglutathione lyase family enzyme
MKLDHVALTVADREVSAEFYGKFFGMKDRVHDDHLLILANEQGDLLALSVGPKKFELPRTNHFGSQPRSRIINAPKIQRRRCSRN